MTITARERAEEAYRSGDQTLQPLIVDMLEFAFRAAMSSMADTWLTDLQLWARNRIRDGANHSVA